MIAYNSGPDAETIFGFKQPLTRGIVSMVAAVEQLLARLPHRAAAPWTADIAASSVHS